MTKKQNGNRIITVLLSLVSLFYVVPILIVIINSFKRKAYVNKYPFQMGPNKLSDGLDSFLAGLQKSFVGIENYIEGIKKIHFFSAFGYSLFITVCTVVVIILFTSMTAWYITRVHSAISKTIFYLCLFSMIVPFQMVMFPLSKIANMLHLGNPVGIVFIYLGFGAGLAVFMFCGFIKSIPLEIEEAAMIDGCNPIQMYFKVIFPILKPTSITVAILEAMWVWNDYLLPYLVLDIRKYKTIPIAIQYLKGGYGSIDWGAMMAMLVLAIIPIIIFYAACQKYIIKGVMAGSVKG
ncbi:carbohydrate ABC transporter permease [Clostridium sp. DL1XJH146]